MRRTATTGFPFTDRARPRAASAPASVTASFAGADAGDSAPGQFSRMTLTFADGLARARA